MRCLTTPRTMAPTPVRPNGTGTNGRPATIPDPVRGARGSRETLLFRQFTANEGG